MLNIWEGHGPLDPLWLRLFLRAVCSQKGIVFSEKLLFDLSEKLRPVNLLFCLLRGKGKKETLDRGWMSESILTSG